MEFIPGIDQPPRRKSNPIILWGGALFLLMICIALYVFTSKPENERQPEVGKSDYQVIDFEEARLALNLEELSQWHHFEGPAFSMQFPSRFRILDNTQRNAVAQIAGADTEETFLQMVAVDSTSVFTSINVISATYNGEPNPGQVIADAAALFKEDDARIIDRSAYRLGNRHVGRLIYQLSSDSPLGSVQFAIIESGRLWWITLGTPLENLDQWVSVGEVIVQTFIPR